MFEDIRFAIRSLSRSKAVTTVLLVSLALGTGVNAAVCGVVYTLLLRSPAGIADPRSLLSISTTEFGGSPHGPSSYPDYLALEAAAVAPQLAAYDDGGVMNVQMGPSARTARVAAVTEGFFEVLGMSASAGRLLERGAQETVVISDTLADFLGHDRETIIGQRLAIGEHTYEIVGVTPSGFRGLRAHRPTDAWIPLRVEGRHQRGDRRLGIVARHPDRGALDASLEAASVRLASEFPATNRGAAHDPGAPRRITAAPYSAHDPDSGSGFAVVAAVVVGAVVLLLASACVNAGTLLLSRAMARRHEVAVKRALGATRVRLVRQLFAESVLVCLGGGALGLLFATWTVRAVPAFFSPDQAELLQTGGLWPLLALTLGVSLVAGIGFGIAPALHGTDAPESLALRADAGAISGSSGRSRTRSLLLVAQLALSTVLLIVTALLVRSLTTALQGDFGVGTRKVALVSMSRDLRCVGHSEPRNTAIQEIPGVERVGWAAWPPLGRGSLRPYSVESGLHTLDRAEFAVNLVSPAYFEAANLDLLTGRGFTEADRTRTEPVAVVDQLLAERYFGSSAVGKYIIDGARNERIRIVGVVRSGRYRTLQEAPQPTVYRPLLQEYLTCGYMVVRTADDPATVLPAIVRHLDRTERAGTVITASTLEHHLANALVVDRITTTLVGLCGVIALVMGAIGVYGAMNDAVSQRTREIGLRVALGAGPAQVVRLVLSEALAVTIAGLALGTIVALVAERALGTAMHGLLHTDGILLARTPLLLGLAVLLASLVPLRRALAVNPATALGLRT